MGRWGGLSSWIDFERGGSTSDRRHGHSGNLTFSTRYNKLDDSIFVLCKNCGHSLKTEELTKMAAYAAAAAAANSNPGAPTPSSTTRFYTSPKQFFTWSASAANHRLQKMSKNLVNNVYKLQTKMEKAFPSSFHLTTTSSTSSSPVPSDSSSDGGFATLRRERSSNNLFNNNNNCDFESSSDTKRFRRNDCKNNLNNGQSRKLYGTTENGGNNNFVYYNNSFVRDSGGGGGGDNSLEFHSTSAPSSNGVLTALDSHNLVKSLDFAMENILKLRPEAQHVFYDSHLSAAPSDVSHNTTSSSSISTAPTVPIASPHWSRASSISIESNSQCDNQAGNNNKKNLNNFKSSNNNTGGPDSDPTSSLCPDDSSPSSSLLKTTPLLCSLPSSLTSSISSSPSSSSSPSTSSSPSSTMSSGSFIVSDSSSSSSSKNQTTMSPTTTTTTSNSKLTVTIFEEEAELKHAPWFQAGIPREIALEVLRNEPIGSFIVRESTTKTGCFALSVRVPREYQPTGIAHYLILKTGRGYKIKGFTKEFGSLTSLITHHSVMPELLPCPLSLHRYRPSHPVRVSRQHSADFVEPEKLISFRQFTDF